MKYYGSYQNRIMENNHSVAEIEIGTGMTEYGYSDRHAYEVIAVDDQKHVTVRKLDHKHVGDGCMDNKWELISNPENPTYNMVKRGKYWYTAQTCTVAELDKMDAVEDINKKMRWGLWFCGNGFDEDVIRAKGSQTKYTRWNVSFGHAEYHYDYEF